MFQSLGRTIGFNYIERNYPALILSAEGFDIISWEARNNSLELWNYCKALTSLEEKNIGTCPMSILSSYGCYKMHEDSFYISDDGIPSFITFCSDYDGLLRRKIIKDRDLHSVNSFNENNVIEVMRAFGPDTPIYLPSIVCPDVPMLYIEDMSIPLWIIANKSITNLPDSVRFCDAISYWIYQLKPSTNKIFAILADEYPLLKIQIVFCKKHSNNRPIEIKAFKEQYSLNVSISKEIRILLLENNNNGERILMREILLALQKILPENFKDLLQPSKVDEMIDKHIPLGQQMKIYSIDLNKRTDLIPIDHIKHRCISKAAIDRYLDKIGNYLLKKEKLPIGVIPKSKHTNILNKVVAFLFAELESLVSTLNINNLIEMIISYHEAAIVDSGLSRFNLALSPLCYNDNFEGIRSIRRSFADNSSIRIANRFLIEYISATPPSGLRPFSVEIYDEMMAIAKLIIDYGNMSDSVIYKLVAPTLKILKSERLENDFAELVSTQTKYFEAFVDGVSYRERVKLSENPKDIDNDSTTIVKVEDIDTVTNLEWGITLGEILLFLKTIIKDNLKIGIPYWSMNLEEFIIKYSKLLSWKQEKTSFVIEFLSLKKRNYLKPSEPYSKNDIYPWKLDRRLSYIQKPFVQMEYQGTIKIIWGCRNLEKSHIYFLNNVYEGKMKGSSQELKQLIGKINDAKGKKFNNKVYNYFRNIVGDNLVRKECKKVGSLRVPGDFDIIAIMKEKKEVVIIECKDFEAARNTYELSRELEKFFGSDESSELSAVDRHTNRVKWANINIKSIVELFNLEYNTKWVIKDYIITDNEMMTPHHKNCSIKIISWSKLCQEGLK